MLLRSGKLYTFKQPVWGGRAMIVQFRYLQSFKNPATTCMGCDGGMHDNPQKVVKLYTFVDELNGRYNWCKKCVDAMMQK